MTVKTKSVRIYENDYEVIVRIQGFLQMRDGRLLTMPEMINKMLTKFKASGKIPDELFTVGPEQKKKPVGNDAHSR